MKKKIIVLIVALFLLTPFRIFADEEAYSRSLAKTQSAINYLNEVYLDKYPELGFAIDYCSPDDLELLEALSKYITNDCTNNTEKAEAIYNWMISNISYGITTNSFSPIDVYKNREGVCSGHSQLMSALFKLSGIPSAIIRCSKQGPRDETVSLSKSNSLISQYQHEFVMAYVEDGWYGYDSCWKWYHMTEDKMAERYVVLHVDGIMAYSDDAWSNSDNYTNFGAIDTWYKDGEFLSMQKNKVIESGGSTLQVGGCLSYNRQHYNRGTDSYYTYIGDGKNQLNHAYSGGYYIPKYDKKKEVLYVRNNGILVTSYYSYNNETYFDGVKINNCIPDLGLVNNKIIMYPGETIDFSSIYPSAYLSSSEINDICKGDVGYNPLIFSFDGQSITANCEGEGSVKISYGDKIYTINICITEYEGDELTQYLCDHDYISDDHCKYCGKEIIDEPEVEPEKENEVIDEDIIIDTEEVVEEETVEEVLEEPIIEDASEEIDCPEVTEEESEQEEESSTEETNITEEPVVEEPVIEEGQTVEESEAEVLEDNEDPEAKEEKELIPFTPDNEVIIEPVYNETVIENKEEVKEIVEVPVVEEVEETVEVSEEPISKEKTNKVVVEDIENNEPVRQEKEKTVNPIQKLINKIKETISKLFKIFR